MALDKPQVIDAGTALILVIPKSKDVEIRDLDALSARTDSVCQGCKTGSIWQSFKSAFG
jgi:hypothetical protein